MLEILTSRKAEPVTPSKFEHEEIIFKSNHESRAGDEKIVENIGRDHET